MIASVVLTSCGGGDAEKDAQRYCDLLCESQELMQKAMSGDQDLLQEATELSQKSITLSNELNQKYKEDGDAWMTILKKMKNCNCY